MPTGWSLELWRLTLVLAASGVVGLAIGQTAALLGLGLAGLLGWYLVSLRRLQRCLERDEDPQGPRNDTGVWGDIHERLRRQRKRALNRERYLSDELREFRVSAAAIPDALVSLGPKWEIRWFNDAATALLGLRAEADRGQSLIHLLRTPELAGYLEAQAFDLPLEINAPGRSDRKLTLRVIRYAEEQQLLIAQDVTQQYRLERVRTDFVANASHELRTPLTVVSGYVENLQHDESDCATRWARPLKLMADQTARMQRIVEDLLLLARLESSGRAEGALQVVGMRQMCAELGELGRSLRAEHAPVQVAVETDADLLGDEQQLRSAFQNLLANAVNYTPADGQVSVRWYLDAQGRGIFDVTDTGEGVAAEHLPRLTERFYRVDTGRSRRKGGTGLGLAIVKHVLHHHDATLEISSELGEGSRFECRFPADRIAWSRPGSAEVLDGVSR
jgi:two-component system phosphate regulon sensor histidine kinase PhoR